MTGFQRVFRYIAFSWNSGDDTQSRTASALQRALHDRHCWQTAFRIAGATVYMTGHKAGVNDAYQLPPNQGVILGKLFRRDAAAPTGRDDEPLSDLEAQRIINSDGRALVDQYWGRYVAFLLTCKGNARVLRDPTGALPCYRVEVLGVNIVLSWLEDLFELRQLLGLSVDWQAVAVHIALGGLSGPETGLEGVTQILAGELTPLNPHDGSSMLLWSAADHARRTSAAVPADAARLLRDTVSDCVHRWASCYGSLLLRLSGGVDSSILLGTLANGKDARALTCLNYYAPDVAGDERAYARMCAQQHGVPLVELAVDEGFRLEALLSAALTPLPVQYVGYMGTCGADSAVAAACQAGAVFNGAGGDQLFFEAQCTWPAADYLKLRGIDRGFLRAVLDAAHLGRVSFWSALHRAMKDRGFHGNPLHGAGSHLTLMPRDALDDAISRAHRYVHPCWLAASDLPIGKFHQLGMVVSPFEYYNPHLRDQAPERVQPLMSQPLVELCLSIPTFVLTQGGRGRGLARSAFADRIPAAIATRRSKGTSGKYIVKVLRNNHDVVCELLLDGLLAKHGLLDRHRTELALADRMTSNTTSALEIHSWVACETWLRVVTARSAGGR